MPVPVPIIAEKRTDQTGRFALVWRCTTPVGC
jgi:hypothetical protein